MTFLYNFINLKDSFGFYYGRILIENKTNNAVFDRANNLADVYIICYFVVMYLIFFLIYKKLIILG